MPEACIPEESQRIMSIFDRFSRGRIIAVLVALTWATIGCGDEDVAGPGDGPEQGPPVRELWYGSYTSTAAKSGSGAVALNLSSVGREVTGEFVLQSHGEDDVWIHVYVRGARVGGDLALGLDREMVDYQFDFTAQGTVRDGVLNASFTHPRLAAELQARSTSVEDVEVESSFEISHAGLGLAFDSELLWSDVDVANTADGRITARGTVIYRIIT